MMENVNFQPSGEEIERAFMDLGPLLGVSIKEETPEEAADVAAPHAPSGDVGSVAGASGGAAGDKEPADSLAPPSPRAPPSAARCVVCAVPLATADGTPKLMECLHSICESCLKAKLEEKQAASRDFLGAERVTILCPVCRLQCQPANMIDQRFVLEKVALEHAATADNLSGEQQCNSCEDTEPATSYCVDCGEFICDNCVHAHQRLKITKDHTIKTREEALAELQAAQGSASSAHDMYCREHVQERLTLFCETCDRLTCRDCQLQHHRDHKYQFSTEMAAQARATITSLLNEVSYKRVLLGSAMKVIRDRQHLIADKKKALVHEITQTVVKLTNAINTRGKQLVLRLNEVCDAKQRTLTEKKEALAQLAAITDHCVEFVSGALEHGSDTALLHAKPQVTQHLQRIKSRRADIPNPEIPVRITLALDKLPDLVRVLSSIGAIVVDGKVDGGGAGAAQGPYHPPAPAPAPAPASPHNAVVALHHAAAMHQSYMQPGGGGGAGGAGALAYLPLAGGLRPRAHTPLRHAHVTSTTHPHHLQGMNELNLRGLLNAAGARAARALPPYHNYHQGQYIANVMSQYASNAYAANAGNAGGRRSGGPRTPSPAPAPPAAAPPPQPHYLAHQQHPQQAKWHIPQHSLTNGGRGRVGRRRVRLQDHAGARAPPARRHLHQPQDAQPQPQRWRVAGAGQGVRGVGAGPDRHHRQAGLERGAGGGGGGVAGRRALVHGGRARRPRRRRPQRGLVRRVHGRRRAHVLRQVPQGVPPVLPHTDHREAARRDGDVAVPAVRQLRGAAGGGGRRGAAAGGRAAGARAETGRASDARALLPVRAEPRLPRARARLQHTLPLQDLSSDVPGHDPHEAAAALAAALHARRAVRRRLSAAVPQRLPLQPAGVADLQGRQAAGGVLRQRVAQVAAGVRVLVRRGRRAAQARALRLSARRRAHKLRNAIYAS